MKQICLLITTFSVLFVLLSLAGCSPAVPDCGNIKTSQSVEELILQNLLGDESKTISDMFSVEVNSIQTETHSKDPEKYVCKAVVRIVPNGKLAEQFGNIYGDVSLMLKGQLPAEAAGKLDRYEKLQFLGNLPGVEFDGPEFSTERLLVLTRHFYNGYFYLDDFLRLDFDPAKKSAAYTAIVMLKLSSTMHQLAEPKTVVFASSLAQQNGESHHFVEIKKLWSKPDLLLVEVAKLSKKYVAEETSSVEQPKVNNAQISTVELPVGQDLDDFRTLYCKDLKKSEAPLSRTEAEQLELLKNKYAGDYPIANESRKQEIDSLWDKLGKMCISE